MRTYKDLDYIQEHLKEIIDETTISELEMYPDYEDTVYWFYVRTENGEMYKIYNHLYIKWFDHWHISRAYAETVEEEE